MPQRLTLAQLLAKRGPLPPVMALDVLDGLAALLETQNLGVEELLALRLEAVELELPDTGGTPTVRLRTNVHPANEAPYLAWPEYGAWWSGMINSPIVDSKGDMAAIYCMGVLLYHMLEDRVPFSAPELVTLAMRHLNDKLPPFKREPGHPAVQDLVQRMMAKRPERRYPSIAELRQSLEMSRPASPPAAELVALVNPSTGTRIPLGQRGQLAPDGTLEIRVGRSDRHTHHTPHIDLQGEPGGKGVHRRQAVLCYTAEGWTIEEWSDPRPRGEEGGPTAVNGVALAAGVKRSVSLGDLIAFGPVKMRFSLLDPPKRGSAAADCAVLANPQTGRYLHLGQCGKAGPDGSVEIRVGRRDRSAGHQPDLDLSAEPDGTGVHRRQAVLRCSGQQWTVEDWVDPGRPRGQRGGPTTVNTAALLQGERRPIYPGDVIGFGPVAMEFRVLDLGPTADSAQAWQDAWTR